MDSLSNWGRWGPEDELGTLNLITPEVRRRAAALVRDGVTVSCGWDILTERLEGNQFGDPRRFMMLGGQGLADEFRVRPKMVTHSGDGDPHDRYHASVEYMCFAFHGQNMTHLDAPCHIFWDRRMYNNRPAELVTVESGATALAVTAAASGIVTRGVLVDLPALLGVRWMSEGEPVHPEHLEMALSRQGVEVRPGDAVLLRTGWAGHRHESGPAPLRNGCPGWHATCMPWLRERDVAVIGCDSPQDVLPSDYPSMVLPVHVLGQVAMGMWLLDNADFEELARVAQARSRYEFLLSIAPLRIEGGTGSPLNPIAVF